MNSVNSVGDGLSDSTWRKGGVCLFGLLQYQGCRMGLIRSAGAARANKFDTGPLGGATVRSGWRQLLLNFLVLF